ncbi:MAG: hypothetical protein EWM72_00595 [Nitrospira sp.]|nr:MAG: hypothetical protein EWM72_00595 [Nitrospira sp.]
MEIFYSEEGGWVSVSALKRCWRAMEWKQPKNGQVGRQSSIVYLSATQTTMHHSLTGNHALSRVFEKEKGARLLFCENPATPLTVGPPLATDDPHDSDQQDPALARGEIVHFCYNPAGLSTIT